MCFELNFASFSVHDAAIHAVDEQKAYLRHILAFDESGDNESYTCNETITTFNCNHNNLCVRNRETEGRINIQNSVFSARPLQISNLAIISN